MKKYSKSIQKQLRKLVGEAHKQQLDTALSALHKEFERWEKNEINCFELNNLIHEFHDGISRDLYKQYIMAANSSHGYLVKLALENNILNPEDISEDVYQAIKS
jgi:hypothetical protein